MQDQQSVVVAYIEGASISTDHYKVFEMIAKRYDKAFFVRIPHHTQIGQTFNITQYP